MEGVASSGSGGRSAYTPADAAVIPDAAVNAALGARHFGGLGCRGRSIITATVALCFVGEAVRLSFKSVAVQHAILPRSSCHPPL